jgi:hypothetical protein
MPVQQISSWIAAATMKEWRPVVSAQAAATKRSFAAAV